MHDDPMNTNLTHVLYIEETPGALSAWFIIYSIELISLIVQ